MNKKAFVTTLPSFIAAQCSSFCWFLSQGILETFHILPFNILEEQLFDLNFYCEHYFFTHSKNTILDAKTYNTTFALKVYIPITFLRFQKQVFRKTEGILEHELLFLGEIPLMTNKGTFIINGYEKIIIHYFIKKQGLIYDLNSLDHNRIYSALLIPKTGVWVKLELNEDILTICINKEKKLNIFDFFKLFYLSPKDLCLLFPCFKLLNFTKTEKRIQNEARLNFQNQLFNVCFYELNVNIRDEFKKTFFHSSNQSTTLTLQDIFSIINHLFFLRSHNILCDEPDHLTNKVIIPVGKILQKQFLFSLHHLKRQLTSRLLNFDLWKIKLHKLINSVSLLSIFNIFFSSSQLVQFFDQTNLLAELAHRNRLNTLSIGTMISLKARDIHTSQFGRICPLETPEGFKTGIILALSIYSQINNSGSIEIPFFIVKNGYILTQFPAIYLTAKEEECKKIAMADIRINSLGKIIQKYVTIRLYQKFYVVLSNEVELIAVSTQQLFSFGASLIPFIEHNDGNRALMGANMQRQSTPLIYPHKPIIGTGLEMQFASDLAIKSFSSGIIFDIFHNFVIILSVKARILRYFIQKYIRTNQDTFNNQRFIIWKGEFVKSGQILADEATMEQGEIALGQNLLVAYMSWNGYNFEDSILINEHLLYSDLLTSIKITQFTLFVKYTINGIEYLTKNIPEVNDLMTKNLDLNGIIKKGIFVQPNDLIIGKRTPFTEKDIQNYSFLLTVFEFKNIFFGYNTSIYATKTFFGRVLDVLICSNESNKYLPKNTRFLITIFFAQIRKITVGDKIAGRHGNKGIISKILANQDMPFLPNGKIIDLILNPLGVPSRMNVGQLFEGLLGFAGTILERRFKILPFDERFGDHASYLLIFKYLQKAKNYSKNLWIFNKTIPGKIIVRDGKTGNCFDNSIVIGTSYFIKLIHFSEDKLHFRSTGPYSLITQQPLHGKSADGGQRFGEMEVWALEAFGAAYTLQEMLNVKSDDVKNRNKLLNSILEDEAFTFSGIPESFKLLILELKALGLDLLAFKSNNSLKIKNFVFLK
uniref:DNA-directed RNA polymerase subunit beta n=1 Tax=Pteridomonas sp. YPF1301 TaxID=2766739 RepID=A0A7G1MNC8_9STRA|nr:RNA polymerase subunit beta [Pteridomonas sp. YPF1301]